MCLAPPLTLVWIFRAHLIGTFPGMFLLIGLPLCLGTALLGMLGFLVQGTFSRYAERSRRAATWAHRLKITLWSLVVAPLGAFGIFLAGSALVTQKVPMFSRRSRISVSLDADPMLFAILVVVWAVVGGAMMLFALRKVRAAYATRSTDREPR